MRNNQSVLIIAGTALAALLGFALWMMFSSQPPVKPTHQQNSQESVQNEQRTETPTPTPAAAENMNGEPSATTNSELQKIEAEFNSSVILDEDFSELEGE